MFFWQNKIRRQEETQKFLVYPTETFAMSRVSSENMKQSGAVIYERQRSVPRKDYKGKYLVERVMRSKNSEERTEQINQIFHVIHGVKRGEFPFVLLVQNS